MSEGARHRANGDPAELWRRWYDASFAMWSSMAGNDKETLMDPFGLYRQWFGNMQETGKPPEGAVDPLEVWRLWIEATTEAWRKVFEAGESMAGLAPYWAEMAEEVRKQVFGAGNPPTDPLDLYLRWYGATSGPLSKMIRAVLEDESFLGNSRRFLENYASLERVLQDAAEEYFGYLRLATRSDSSRVAGLMVGLDAKVDQLEEAFEQFEEDHARSAGSVQALEGRMEDLEGKLDDARSGLQRVEGKLDRLLASLEAGGDDAPTGPREEATGAARREAEELGVDLREVRGSGAGGRITVDDVRRKGGAG